MKNKIAVGCVLITLLIIFGINILTFFPEINSKHNVVFLSANKLIICITFSIVLFIVFSYSWLTYAFSFYTYLGIFATLHRVIYPELTMWSTNTVRIFFYFMALILTFLTFYILKKLKVNMAKKEEGPAVIDTRRQKANIPE